MEPGIDIQLLLNFEGILPELIKLIDTVDLEGGPGTSFCSL
jgi:hypothetical protein